MEVVTTDSIPQDVHVLEYMDKIDELFEKMPDKRTKDYKTWVQEYDDLVLKVNGWVGFKMYNTYGKKVKGRNKRREKAV